MNKINIRNANTLIYNTDETQPLPYRTHGSKLTRIQSSNRLSVTMPTPLYNQFLDLYENYVFHHNNKIYTVIFDSIGTIEVTNMADLLRANRSNIPRNLQFSLIGASVFFNDGTLYIHKKNKIYLLNIDTFSIEEYILEKSYVGKRAFFKKSNYIFILNAYVENTMNQNSTKTERESIRLNLSTSDVTILSTIQYDGLFYDTDIYYKKMKMGETGFRIRTYDSSKSKNIPHESMIECCGIPGIYDHNIGRSHMLYHNGISISTGGYIYDSSYHPTEPPFISNSKTVSIFNKSNGNLQERNIPIPTSSYIEYTPSPIWDPSYRPFYNKDGVYYGYQYNKTTRELKFYKFNNYGNIVIQSTFIPPQFDGNNLDIYDIQTNIDEVYFLFGNIQTYTSGNSGNLPTTVSKLLIGKFDTDILDISLSILYDVNVGSESSLGVIGIMDECILLSSLSNNTLYKMDRQTGRIGEPINIDGEEYSYALHRGAINNSIISFDPSRITDTTDIGYYIKFIKSHLNNTLPYLIDGKNIVSAIFYSDENNRQILSIFKIDEYGEYTISTDTKYVKLFNNLLGLNLKSSMKDTKIYYNGSKYVLYEASDVDDMYFTSLYKYDKTTMSTELLIKNTRGCTVIGNRLFVHKMDHYETSTFSKPEYVILNQDDVVIDTVKFENQLIYTPARNDMYSTSLGGESLIPLNDCMLTREIYDLLRTKYDELIFVPGIRNCFIYIENDTIHLYAINTTIMYPIKTSFANMSSYFKSDYKIISANYPDTIYIYGSRVSDNNLALYRVHKNLSTNNITVSLWRTMGTTEYVPDKFLIKHSISGSVCKIYPLNLLYMTIYEPYMTYPSDFINAIPSIYHNIAIYMDGSIDIDSIWSTTVSYPNTSIPYTGYLQEYKNSNIKFQSDDIFTKPIFNLSKLESKGTPIQSQTDNLSIVYKQFLIGAGIDAVVEKTIHTQILDEYNNKYKQLIGDICGISVEGWIL